MDYLGAIINRHSLFSFSTRTRNYSRGTKGLKSQTSSLEAQNGKELPHQ